MSVFKKIQEREAAAVVTKTSLTRSIVSTALILSVLSVAVTAYITTAWFSANKKVDNTGVHMNVQTSPNMFIANGDQTVTNGTPVADSSIAGTTFRALTASSSLLRVEFNDPTTTGNELLLTPVTRIVPSSVTTATPSDYGLYYLTNPSIIDRNSGVKTSSDYLFQPVTSTNRAQYFLEHKVLLASTDGVLLANGLTATFSAYMPDSDPDTDDPVDNAILTVGATTPYHAYNSTTDTYADYKYAYDHTQIQSDTRNMYQYAASVDIYAKLVQKSAFDEASEHAEDITVAAGDYKGTLNLAKKNNGTWNILSATAGNDISTAPAGTVTLLGGANNANINIPWNAATGDSDNCCVVVVMRFYFDGALLYTQDLDNVAPDNNKAYVHSAYLDIASMPNLCVKFEATDPA